MSKESMASPGKVVASPSGPSTSTATDEGDRSAHGRVAAFLETMAGEKEHSESRLRQLLVQKETRGIEKWP